MGKQSSRIIWGRTGEDGNAKTPVEMYDPVETIYVKDNMALVTERVNDQDETRCYICKVIESAGEWETVKNDWRMLQSVSKYDTKKEYKKGAKCIYDGYYWNCTHDITRDDIMRHINDDVLVPTSENYWEYVMQTVAVTYHAMDHKEVYYDNGSNRCKWHRAMWFVPDEDWFDEEHEEEIAEWDPNRQYEHIETKEKGDMVIKTFSYISGEVRKLYECRVRHTTAGDTSWHPEQWREVDDVTEWDHHVAYAKGTYVIRGDIPVGEFNIVRFSEFGDMAYFKAGDKCIHFIDRDDKTSLDPDVRREYSALPEWVKTKVEKVGTRVSSLYQLKTGIPQPNMSNFERTEWILIGQAFDLFIGQDYEQGDSVIWSYSGADAETGYAFQSVCVFTALEALPAIQADQTPTADPSKWGEPWKQVQTAKPQIHLYKAKKNLTPNMNDKWRKENWIICTQMMKTNELDCYGWIWKKLSDQKGHGAPFGNFFPTYGGSRYSYDSEDNTDRRGRLGSLYLSSTEAIFDAPTTYSFHTAYKTLKYYVHTYVTSGSGFTYVKTFMSMAYGFPLWDSTEEDYGMRNYAMAEYSNYFYVKLFDDWTKIILPDYVRMDLFTPLNSGFSAYTEFDYDLNEYNQKKFICKLTFSENQLISMQHVPFVLNADLSNYSYVYDKLTGLYQTYFTNGNHVLFAACRQMHYTHFWNNDDYHSPFGDDQEYHLYEYVWYEYYSLGPNGTMVCYTDEPYLYENRFGGSYRPNFMVTHLKEHVGKKMRPDTEIEYFPISKFGINAIEDALNHDGFTLVTVPRPDISPTYVDYYARGWYDYLYTTRNCESVVFDSINGSSTYRLWHLSYLYQGTESGPKMARSTFWLQTFSSINTVTTVMVYDEEEEYTTGQVYPYDTYPYLATSLPLGKIYRIGRIDNKYYFAIGSANGYTNGYHNGSGIYELDLDANEIVQVSVLNTRDKFEDGILLKNIRYINNGSVTLYDHWGHGGPEYTYHKVSRLHLCLTPDFYNPHDFKFVDADEAIILSIPLVDNNSFAISTGGSAATIYTGDIFLHDHVIVFYTQGAFVHIRGFNIRNLQSTAFQSFFWMSAGNDSGTGRDSGDFYGGYDRAPYSFELPLVF